MFASPVRRVSAKPSLNERSSSDLSAVTLGASARLETYPHGAEIGKRLARAFRADAVLDPAGCETLGVPAFAENGRVHFKSPTPSLRVAAHEAAHVLQHEGETYDMGLGAERHADALASRIADGRDAEPMLGKIGARVPRARYKYSEIEVAAQSPAEWDAKMKLRVSDNGLMAVGQEGAQHSFWADLSQVSVSNATLDSVKSVIRLMPLSETIKGSAPSGTGTHTLVKVAPLNVSNGTTGENMNIWADCGKSGRDVMGAGTGTGENYDKMAAVYKVPITLPESPTWYKPWDWNAKAKGGDTETAAASPKSMKKEILMEKGLGFSGDAALARYEAMSETDRDNVDKSAGINKYAMPKTGEGYTMSSGGANVPGRSTWNFHWAGVVMALGTDHTTLENYSISDPAVRNQDWIYQMYGSAQKPGQTFYEQHKASGQHGEVPIAMRVRKRE